MPYEKFLERGPQFLSNAELLAVIIRTGTVGADSIEVAREVFQFYDCQEKISDLHYLKIEDLMKVKGIGKVKAVKILCVLELSTRIAISKAKEKLSFTNPATIANYYMEKMRYLRVEEVLLLLLDGKNHLIKEEIISKGTVNASLVSPREIMICALEYHAVYFILLHNHPSGDATPSKQDIEVTKRLNEVGHLLDIPILDHIIIGDQSYYSLKENGLF